MAAPARAHLESLLRAKKLDITLLHGPPVADRPALPVGHEALDAALGGGLPRGELSELAGPRSSGRTTLTMGALAATTGRGELAALVDALDRFDVESAGATGVTFSRLLWVRGLPASIEAIGRGGSAGPHPSAGDRRGAMTSAGGAGQQTVWRAVERAIKAFTLVLESRAFALAVCDLADVPAAVLRRLPFTTWFRLARLLEGGETAALVVAPERVGRSAGGVTVAVEPSCDRAEGVQWRGTSDRARLFGGIVPRVRVLGACR